MRWFIGLLLTIPVLADAAGIKHYSTIDVQALQESLPVLAQQERLRQLLELRDWSELERWAGAELAAAGEAPLTSESLLYEWLNALRASAPPDSTRELVHSFTTYESLALAPPPEPEHRDRGLIAAFDVAGAARGTLRSWELRDNTARASAALADGRARDLVLDDAEAWTAALEDAPPSQLENLRQQPPLLAQPMAVLARRLKDANLYRALFSQPADAFVLRAVAEVPATLPPADAVSALETARANPALTSAAIIALGKLPAAQPALLECLSDAGQGGSCASALAQNPANEPALARVIGGGADDLKTRRALLALLWMPGDTARAALHEYVADARTPAQLRVEVAQWLQ